MFNNLTGRPLYNGGSSYAPNRGSVGAAGAKGYMKRELRKDAIQQHGGSGPFGGVSQFGSDGESDTRSGIAARGLAGRAQQYMQSNGTGSVMGQPTFGGGGGPRRPGQQQGQQRPPHVTISKDGILQLPFDYQNASQAVELQRNLNKDLMDLQMDQQGVERDYLEGTRQNEQEYASNSRQALAGRAASGAAFSSAYGNDVSNLATGFNNQRASLDTNYNMFNQNADLQRNAASQYMNDMLQQLAVDRAEQLNSQAGSLGYGRIPKNGPRRKKAGKR